MHKTTTMPDLLYKVDMASKWSIHSYLPGFTKSARKVYIYEYSSQLPLSFSCKQPNPLHFQHKNLSICVCAFLRACMHVFVHA